MFQLLKFSETSSYCLIDRLTDKETVQRLFIYELFRLEKPLCILNSIDSPYEIIDENEHYSVLRSKAIEKFPEEFI